jgi:hypothetical protein
MNIEGKRPFGRLGQRWQFIKLGPNEIGYEGVGWIHQAQDVVQLCEHGNRFSGCGKCGQCLEYLTNC